MIGSEEQHAQRHTEDQRDNPGDAREEHADDQEDAQAGQNDLLIGVQGLGLFHRLHVDVGGCTFRMNLPASAEDIALLCDRVYRMERGVLKRQGA